MDIPKVSVIVPIYNVEKYLKRCVDSILNQTLKEIEVICLLRWTLEYKLFTSRMKDLDLQEIVAWSWQRESMYILLIRMIIYA